MSDVRARLSRLAWLLDSSIPIPGTRFSIGLDALIGLVPVAGDLAGVILSAYIVKQAAALGVPGSVLARMALNVGVEGLVGMVPLAGDLFDAAFKANQRNVRLLNAYLEHPARTARASRGVMLAIGLAGLLMLLAFSLAGFLLARWISSWF